MSEHGELVAVSHGVLDESGVHDGATNEGGGVRWAGTAAVLAYGDEVVKVFDVTDQTD